MQSILLTMPNDLDEVNNLLKVVNVFLEPRHFSANIITAINLVIEESLMNTIQHGYDDDIEHLITLQLTIGKDEVALRFEDDAREFNPLATPRMEKSEALMDSAKGLGIHLIRNMMNAMTYSRIEDKNILEIWIYLR
ncbi:MAG: ATP-binding protein [Desulfobacterales bacterium]|nr:ATP-binding protein [Desulfobacterales bacterium]